MAVTVSTWQDFVTAVGTSGAEVELDADIDMNEVMPGGVTGRVGVSCKSIDGGGHTIRGLSADGLEDVFYLNPVNSIKDLHFIDLYLTDSRLFAYPFECGLVFENCTFAGRMQATKQNSTGMFTNERSIRDIKFQRCAFSFDTVGDVQPLTATYYSSRYWVSLYNCNVYINAKSYSDADYMTFSADDTYCSGTFTNGLAPLGNRSVINAVVTGGTVSGWSGSIINSDKIAQGVSVSGLTQVTDEQMRDAEYLNSIGFPCGVK